MQGHQRKGHARALLAELSGALRASGVPSLVASIDDKDQQTAAVMRRNLNFLPVEPLRVADWSSALPAYHAELLAGCTMLHLAF